MHTGNVITKWSKQPESARRVFRHRVHGKLSILEHFLKAFSSINWLSMENAVLTAARSRLNRFAYGWETQIWTRIPKKSKLCNTAKIDSLKFAHSSRSVTRISLAECSVECAQFQDFVWTHLSVFVCVSVDISVRLQTSTQQCSGFRVDMLPLMDFTLKWCTIVAAT